jgi:hypothetical protein
MHDLLRAAEEGHVVRRVRADRAAGNAGRVSATVSPRLRDTPHTDYSG